MFGTVIRRRAGAKPKGTRIAVKTPECDKLRSAYSKADKGAERMRARNPRRALEMSQEGNAALIAALKLDCRWVKRLRPRTVHLRGALGPGKRPTVTCKRLQRKFRRYRQSKDQPGMIGARARARKLRCDWARGGGRRTARGY